MPDTRIAYGRVISSDFPLTRLPVGVPGSPADIVIQTTYAEAAAHSEERFFHRQRRACGVSYSAGGVGEFVIDDGGRRISATLEPNASQIDVEHILTGPALTMALQLQGRFILHAACFEYQGGLFAISAPHAYGKSTLAASFLAAGLTVYSDDVLPLSTHDGYVYGRQGQPWIKLWDETLAELGGEAEQYTRVLEGYDKRVIPALDPTDTEMPLRGLFLLQPHLRPDSEIEVDRIGGAQAAIAILANVHSPEIIEGSLARTYFDFATELAQTVPVHTISYERTFANLPKVRDRLLQAASEVVHA